MRENPRFGAKQKYHVTDDRVRRKCPKIKKKKWLNLHTPHTLRQSPFMFGCLFLILRF